MRGMLRRRGLLIHEQWAAAGYALTLTQLAALEVLSTTHAEAQGEAVVAGAITPLLRLVCSPRLTEES